MDNMPQIEMISRKWNKTKVGDEIKMKRVDDVIFIDVKILNKRTSYGHEEWLVTPVKGKGEMWVRNILLEQPK